jgi:hypothetical protein
LNGFESVYILEERARARKLHRARRYPFPRGTELQIPLAELKQRTKAAPLAHLDGFATLANAEREHIVRALSETN